MARLNQVLAIERSVKNENEKRLTQAHHLLLQSKPLSGLSRRYRPKNDDGDQLPSESTKVQATADEIIAAVIKSLTELFDIVATKEAANTQARADVIIDGGKLLAQVPATTLLYLEKKLVDIHTFVKGLPVLDPSETWRFDTAQNCWVTDPVETTRTKKIMQNHVKAPATDKHPAQVDTFTEDVVVGYWTTVKMPGALPAKRVAELVARVEKLQHAVKFAREQANTTDAAPVAIGAAVFGYLFAE